MILINLYGFVFNPFQITLIKSDPTNRKSSLIFFANKQVIAITEKTPKQIMDDINSIIQDQT